MLAHTLLLLLPACLLPLSLGQDRIHGINHEGLAARPLGKPYEDWELGCARRRSIGGFRHRVYVSGARGSDVQVYAFCRDIAHTDDPVLRVSERHCRDTEPFSLQAADPIELEDVVHNCAEGEFVRAINSDYYADNQTRFMNFRCCKPFNAEIDKFIGCNLEGPLNLYTQYYGFLKDPYDPRADCPRDALVGVKYLNGTMHMKFCPFRIAGRDYLSICPELKTTALAKSSSSDIKISADSLYRLQSGQWSGVHQGWNFQCKGFKVVREVSIGFQFHPDEVRRDTLFRFECGPLTEEPQSAKKVRVTAWTPISWKGKTIDDYGCKDQEVLTGMASFFDEKKQIRYVSLTCAEHCNAQLDEAEDPRLESEVLRWGEVKAAVAEMPEALQNIGLELEGISRVSLQSYVAKYSYLEEATCESSTKQDDNTGETLDPWTPELDIPLTPGMLPRVPPDTWTAAGESWRVECPKDQVVQSYEAKAAKGDLAVNLKCGFVTEEPQEYRMVRIAKWSAADNRPAEQGCRDAEALKGMMSYYHPEEKKRYFSVICMDAASAEAEGEPTPVGNDLGDEAAQFVGDDGAVVKNVFIETVEGTTSMTAEFAKFKFVEPPRFEDSLTVDEIEGVSGPILDVDPDTLPPPAEGNYTDLAGDWKFECPGFSALANVTARSAILEDGSDDHQFLFECAPVIEGDNVATATRLTVWSELHSMKIKLACRGQEVMQGLASHWHPEKRTRFFSFICTEGSNANVTDGPRVKTFDVKEGVNRPGVQMYGDIDKEAPGGEVMSNYLASGFIYRLVRSKWTAYLSKFKFVDEPKFTESSKVNEATGEVAPAPPSLEEVCCLPMLPDGESSKPGEGFKFLCGTETPDRDPAVIEDPNQAVKTISSQVVEWPDAGDGVHDITWSFKCAPIVEGEIYAYKLRYTKWEWVRKFSVEKACKENELLHGWASFVREGEKPQRFVQAACMEVSNMEKVNASAPQSYSLSKEKVTISHEEDAYRVESLSMVVDDRENTFNQSVVFAHYAFKLVPGFVDCEIVDESSGKTELVDGCGAASGEPPGIKGEGFCALEAPCPFMGFVYHEGCPRLYGCYNFVEAPHISWEDAAAECEQKHKGRLANLETHIKWAFAHRSGKNDGSRYWLGLNRASGAGALPEWHGGDVFRWSKWMPIDPTVEPIVRSCVLMRNDVWYYDVCDSTWVEGYVCEVS